MEAGGPRLQRHHSYSSFNPRTPLPPITPRHPNHGLQLDQVAEDEPIENKLVLPDDMVNYLNLKGNGDKMKCDSKPTRRGTPNTHQNQQMPSPAYSGQTMPSPAYSGQQMMSPAYSNQPVQSPASNYQYPQPSPGYSPAHPHGYGLSMQSPAPQQQFSGGMAGQAGPSQGFSQLPQGYHQQAMPQNYGMPQHQQSQPYQYQQQPGQQQMMGHMYGPMMQQQQGRYGVMGVQQGGAGFGMGQGGYGPVHACGHLAPPNLPTPAYQAPCAGCQNRGGSAMGSEMGTYQNQQGAMANWQGSQLGLNQYPAQQQYPTQQQPHMNMMGPQGPVGYMGMNNQYQNSVMAAGGMMPMQYQGSLAGDVQCRDVSQSSQSKGGKSKNSKNTSCAAAGEAAACSTPSGTPNAAAVNNNPVQPPPAATDACASVASTVVDTKPSDTNPVDTKCIDTKATSKTFMKPDTYQRTLEYVQQCRSWSSTMVKEEVTSTTDQKPELNPNGTVSGYTGPGSQSSAPQQSTQPPAQQSTSQGTSTSRFATPLPSALAETSNMVINDMTSSLTSLQEENKYLQMIQ